MKLKEFEIKDWYKIKCPSVVYGKEIENAILESTKCGVNFSIVDNNRVIAVGGIVYLKEEITEAWLKVSKKIKKKIKFLRLIKTGFDILASTFSKNVVIQSHVLSGATINEKLVKYLGFYKTVDSMDIQNERYDRYVKSLL